MVFRLKSSMFWDHIIRNHDIWCIHDSHTFSRRRTVLASLYFFEDACPCLRFCTYVLVYVCMLAFKLSNALNKRHKRRKIATFATYHLRRIIPCISRILYFHFHGLSLHVWMKHEIQFFIPLQRCLYLKKSQRYLYLEKLILWLLQN